MEWEFTGFSSNAEGPVYMFENTAGKIIHIGYNWQNQNEFVIVARTSGISVSEATRKELFAKCLKIEEE